MEMTPKVLKGICRSLDLYQTPELNDKLYLHYKGFSAISNLEPYTGLRVLYLEGNGLTDLSGLSAQQQLRCLYLQENRIEAIDSLAPLPNLSTLNLNQNFISALPCTPLSTTFPLLHTLSLKANRLATVDSLASLAAHPTLAVLDLSHNRFDHPPAPTSPTPTSTPLLDALLTLLSTLPSLRVLYLSPAPFLQSTSNYRKRVLSQLPQLTYLDDRPVFEEERRLVEGWSRGGVQGEREAKGRMREEEKEKAERQWRFFDDLVSRGKAKRAGEEGEGKEGGEGRGANAQEEKEQLSFGLEGEEVKEPVTGEEEKGGEKREERAQPAGEGVGMDGEVEQLVLGEGEKVSAVEASAALKAWGSEKAAAEMSGGAVRGMRGPVQSLLSGDEKRKAGAGKMLIEIIDDGEVDA